MPNFLSILISLIAFQASTIAAPNQKEHAVINDNLEDISAFDNPFELSESSNTDQSSLNDREKRFFDSIFPSIDLFNRRESQYPNYNGYTNPEYNRNSGGSGGGVESLFRNPNDIWLELFSNRRQPIVLPIFVQPITCVCPGGNSNAPPTKDKEPVPPSTNAPPNGGDLITPPSELTNRFNTELNNEDDDGRRPISFKPSEPKRPPSQTPPPFEHGSIQEGIESPNSPNTNNRSPAVPPLNNFNDFSPSPRPETSARMPSICEGAIIACCFQTNIGNCFERQGCPDPSIFGDPCDPPVVLRVLEGFQSYYKQRGIVKTF